MKNAHQIYWWLYWDISFNHLNKLLLKNIQDQDQVDVFCKVIALKSMDINLEWFWNKYVNPPKTKSLPTHQNKHKNINLSSWALNHLTGTALEMNAQDLLGLQGEVQMLSEAIETRVEKICPDCKGEGRPEGFADCRTCDGKEFI